MSDDHVQPDIDGGDSRRQFLKISTQLAVAGGVAAGSLAASLPVHAAGSDVLRIGLIGCGGRGTGAAGQALRADANVKLTAMADAFEDRLQLSLNSLRLEEQAAGKIDVPPDRQFIGFDAYQRVIESDVDVVLLTAPHHFRPLHLQAAVAAGKHVFAEKPVAVDAPGVRSVLATCQEAKHKGLSIVSGLCLRYDPGFQQTVQRIHGGAIGDVHTLFANDYRGPIWVKPRQPDWTDMHWQMRNWYYFTWLSGDFNVEQHVHYLDVCAWIMGSYPASAIGMGGRQVRTGEQFGNIYDHHSVTYEYENGGQLVSNCRQQRGCQNLINSLVYGTKGHAEVSERRLTIHTDSEWRFREKVPNMYQVEHDELFASIRSGSAINNGDYMASSTLLAIMGRMATYTGQRITWDQAMNSQEDLTPHDYAWDDAPEVRVAVPGITQFS
jgi:predicted dehydrogenase